MKQLHNNVLQSKAVKTLSHYVIICSTQNHARVQESEEISMCTGQGRLDTGDLQALRWYCIKKMYNPVMEITARVQSLSVNTVCHPQMQVKVLSPKEAVCERDIKMSCSSLAQS